MTERETNIRSVVFLVIGILLLLSLVICIYIVGSESDLVKISAEVLEVKKDADGTGKNDVTVLYEVDGTSYKYNFYYKDKINEGDFIDIFYHEKNNTSVTTFKTPKIIFVCPLIGLGLCILGIFELFKKNDDGAEEFKTSVIGVVGNTQQLKIVTNDTPVQEYVKTPEEEVEAQVKTIKKEVEPVPVIPVTSQPEETSTIVDVSEIPEIPEVPIIPEIQKAPELPVVSETPEKKEKPIVEQKMVTAEEKKSESETKIDNNDLPTEKKDVKNESTQKSVPKATVSNGASTPAALINGLEEATKEENTKEDVKTEVKVEAKVETKDEVKENAKVEEKEEPKEEKKSYVEEELVKRVQKNIDSEKKETAGLAEDDIKKVIKDVLKEVIQEVNVEKEPVKKVEQKRVLPNYYYISGTSLIYEEPGKEAKEISLKTIKSIVRTVNKAGSVVKLVVSNDEVKCILTNMKNIDLEQVANLLRNKMHAIDDTFEEQIENKEY